MSRARDNANLVSLANSKGDVYTATADNLPTVLTVGTTGQYLQADSTQPTGLKWTFVDDSPNNFMLMGA